MDGDGLLGGHEEGVTVRGIEADEGGLLVEAAAEAPTAADEVNDGEAVVAGDSEGELAGRMEGEVIDGVAVDGERLKVDKAVSVEDGEGAVSVSGDEVSGEGEVGRGVEGEGGDGGGVLLEGAEGGGG